MGCSVDAGDAVGVVAVAAWPDAGSTAGTVGPLAPDPAAGLLVPEAAAGQLLVSEPAADPLLVPEPADAGLIMLAAAGSKTKFRLLTLVGLLAMLQKVGSGVCRSGRTALEQVS